MKIEDMGMAPIDVSNMYYAIDKYGSPCIVQADGEKYMYLPLFKTVEELKGVYAKIGLVVEGTICIQNNHEFLSVMEAVSAEHPDFRLVMNMAFLPSGGVSMVVVTALSQHPPAKQDIVVN